jgi:hypothetical protein
MAYLFHRHMRYLMMYEKKSNKQITEEETSGDVVSKHFNRNQLVICAGTLKQSVGAIGTELIPWNRFLGSLKVKKFGLCCFRCVVH